jgi:hypothetical protein
MVLLGNSHSTMWLPGMSARAKADGWQLKPVLKEGCRYDELVAAAKPGECARWYAWARQQVAALHPDLVVISTYARPGWERGIEMILDDLAALHTRVLLLADVPGLSQKPVDCLLRPGADQGTCLMQHQPAKADAASSARRMAQAHGVQFLDPAPWFCSDGRCPSVIDGVVPYADGLHLTGTYARYLARELAPVLCLTCAKGQS